MRLGLAERIADYGWIARSLLNGHPGLAELSARLPATPDPGRPVAVFLPGVGEGDEYLGPLAAAFVARGWQVRSGYLGGRTLAPVPRLASQIIRGIESYEAPTVLIGHSKGGLVGRAVMTARVNGAVATPSVRGLVTVATPWYGSVLAHLFPRRSPVGTLIPGGPDIVSPWSATRERQAQLRTTSIAPSWDPHVPGRSDLVAGRNLTAPMSGHFRVLGDEETIEMVCREAEILLESSAPERA